FLVFGCCAEAEVGRLQKQAFTLACFHPLVCRLECKLHRDRSIGSDLLEDGFSARDQFSWWHDLVDETDTIGFLRADHLPRENELQCAALADQSGHPLRSTATWNQSQFDFGLT